MSAQRDEFGCGCDCGCDRRDFLASLSAALGGLAFTTLEAQGSEAAPVAEKKRGASVRVVFLYPPSKVFADNADGWWSWPGNDYDSEGRQKQYSAALREVEQKLGTQLTIDEAPIAGDADVKALCQQIERQQPDGLAIIMFYNRSQPHADALLAAAEKLKVPAIFYIGLGVKHGPVRQYRRPGVYFIQSLDNFNALQFGLRMINTRKLMGQSRILSISEAKNSTEATEGFFGTKIRVVPFAEYAAEFKKVAIDAEARQFIAAFTGGAREIRRVTQEALENAARAHFALKKLLADHQADGLTMNCLRRGMLKPCISFSAFNSELVPAACENDVPAALTQLWGQLLIGRPGFQHNPAFETERNHYFGSHCTCPTRSEGPDGPTLPFLLRRFAHTNEGSCAIQVFWKEGAPVTIARYYPGKTPMLDVYAGKVFRSHAMPPVGGCTTNVEIEITDRVDACMVGGHHNLIFSGDFARQFKLFAQLYDLRLGNGVYAGAEPV